MGTPSSGQRRKAKKENRYKRKAHPSMPLRFLALSLIAFVRAPAAPPPTLMLWAWERPGDLRELPTSAGVAFLAASIYLNGTSVRTVPRFQPLRLSPKTYRMAVIRLETPTTPQPLSAHQRQLATQAILDTVHATHPNALQLDFDS